YTELDQIWQTVLLHQFHDILPGSSIAWVHREVERAYRDIEQRLETIITGAFDSLIDQSVDENCTANAAPHPRGGVAALGIGAYAGPASTVRVTTKSDGWILDNGRLRVRVDRTGALASV